MLFLVLQDSPLKKLLFQKYRYLTINVYTLDGLAQYFRVLKNDVHFLHYGNNKVLGWGFLSNYRIS